MFLDWKNQHCENNYTTQSNLQIQCNPYQTTTELGIFHRTRTKNFTIYMETQKTPNSQSNLKKEKWSWLDLAWWCGRAAVPDTPITLLSPPPPHPRAQLPTDTPHRWNWQSESLPYNFSSCFLKSLHF